MAIIGTMLTMAILLMILKMLRFKTNKEQKNNLKTKDSCLTDTNDPNDALSLDELKAEERKLKENIRKLKKQIKEKQDVASKLSEMHGRCTAFILKRKLWELSNTGSMTPSIASKLTKFTGKKTLIEIAEMKRDDIASIPQIGPVTIAALDEIMNEFGLSYGSDLKIYKNYPVNENRQLMTRSLQKKLIRASESNKIE